MADEPTTPNATPETPATPAVAPASPLDLIREAVGNDDGNTAETGGETPAEGETPTGVPAKEGEAPAPSEAPSLSDEQLAALSADPRVRAAVLQSPEGRNILDELFQEVMAESQEQTNQAVVQQQQQATLQEAIAQARDGDTTALGEMFLGLVDEQARQQEIATKYVEPLKAQAFDDLDTAIADVYGAEIEALTEAEAASLARQNFPSDAAFIAGVLKTLDTKRGEGIRSESSGAVADATKVAELAVAGAKARNDVGVRALPGGSGVDPKNNLGDLGIGALIREGMRGVLGDED